ncbi:MAG: DUF2442 domain-containing protein [Gemmatimonadota bacterium]
MTKVEHLGHYRVRLEFTDGAVKDADLSEELFGEVFEPLRNPQLFREGKLNEGTGTIEWPNGADFAPEFLSRIGSDVEQAV